jgi:hypothetical protein
MTKAGPRAFAPVYSQHSTARVCDKAQPRACQGFVVSSRNQANLQHLGARDNELVTLQCPDRLHNFFGSPSTSAASLRR